MSLALSKTRWEIACRGRSHAGHVRTGNDDAFGFSPARGIVAVADGMGSDAFGRYVADRTVAAICEVMPADDFDGSLVRIREAIGRTNREIWRRSEAMRTTMGATFVAAAFAENRLGILWAGDCRGYLLRDGNLYSLSRDHTAVQQLVDSRRIDLFESFDHAMSNVVTRVLGRAAELTVDSGNHAILPDDILLLSTDGLHGSVSDEAICRCLVRHGLDAGDALIELALSAGGRDNVTVVLAGF